MPRLESCGEIGMKLPSQRYCSRSDLSVFLDFFRVCEFKELFSNLQVSTVSLEKVKWKIRPQSIPYCEENN